MKRKEKQELRRQARAAKEVERRQVKAEKKAANQLAKEQRHQGAREAKRVATDLPNKKRRHHYVWQHYLRSFTVEGKLWCQMGDRGFPATTETIAYARDFYRLKELTEYDLKVVDTLVMKATLPGLPELTRGWLPTFQGLFEMQRAYAASGRKDPLFEEHLDVALNNFEEDLHSTIEGQAVPILAALHNRERRVFEDRDIFGGLAKFLAFQHMRTPKVMKASLASVDGLMPEFNVEAAWGLLRTIFATNIGAGMFAQHRHVHATYLDSATGTEFITGDRPTLNTFRSLDENTPPTELEFYYPLSPTRALLMGFKADSPTVTGRRLSLQETHDFNKLIVGASDLQLYGTSQQAVAAALK